MLAPIILFVYNRLDHTQGVIETLSKNFLAKESELYVFSDAAKSENGLEKVNAVREYIRDITWHGRFKKVSIIEAENNKGLANSVIGGVTEIIREYGKVIVVEDDLLLSPYFLNYMNDALDYYQDDKKIWSISGYSFPMKSLKKYSHDIFYSYRGCSWGWATWDRAWKHFNSDGKALLAELESKKLTYTFDFNGKYGFTRMLRRQIEGKNNSWAIRWNASLFLKNILSLNVGRSLVQNVGFDGSGTNCGGGDLYASDIYLKKLPIVPISPIEENLQARQAYINYYASTNSFWAKAFRRIKRTLKGDFGA